MSDSPVTVKITDFVIDHDLVTESASVDRPIPTALSLEVTYELLGVTPDNVLNVEEIPGVWDVLRTVADLLEHQARGDFHRRH